MAKQHTKIDKKQKKEATTNTLQQSVQISGMHCASCAVLATRAIKQLPGVTDVNVNFATGQAQIASTTEILFEAISCVVAKAGYTATQTTSNSWQQSQDEELALAKKRLLWSIAFSIPIFVIGMVLMWLSIDVPYKPFILFALATPVQFYAGWHFYVGAWSALKQKSANMDSLIVLGTLTAYMYSVWVIFFAPLFEQYFEISALLISFVLLGKYLEAYSKRKTSRAIEKLMNLTPKTATIIVAGKEKVVLVDTLKTGDLIFIKPGEAFAVDGVIVKGASTLDESMLTGESMPVDKHNGDTVFAGTINLTSALTYKVTTVGAGTTLSKIIKLVSDAQSKRASVERLADAISAYFVPVVIVLSLLTFSSWYFIIGKPLGYAILNAIAVIVIACPCALGLATPTAILVGTGKGAQHGILIKGGDVLERIPKVTDIVFDKTGTITNGKPIVTDVVGVTLSENALLVRVAAIESHSEHPLAAAVVSHATSQKIIIAKNQVTAFVSHVGKGVTATIAKKKYTIGTEKLLLTSHVVISAAQKKKITELQAQGKTVLLVGEGKAFAGIIALSDSLKTGVAQTITQLHTMGITTHLLTGDNELVAKSIATQAGITQFYAQVLPHQKEQKIKELQSAGKTVAMIGDGINDAPALATADIGIAMGSGTDIAMESGSIVLMSGDITKVVGAMTLGRATMRTIKRNLFWAFAYNVIGIPIAAGVLVPITGWQLSPLIAGATMAASSVSVVMSSLLLTRIKLQQLQK